MNALLSRSVFFVYRQLPPLWRYRLKDMFHVNGHASGALDRLKGMRDADGKKRLDRAFAAVTASLRAAGVASLEGARCLEVGAGFVPSDSLCFFLLGAQRIVSSDYNRILQIEALQRAVTEADDAVLETLARPYMAPRILHHRLERLRGGLAGGEAGLRALGITYDAPLDLSRASPQGPFDLIYSISVLEHIPIALARPILANLASAMAPGGLMLHDIHLEDHLDMAGDPFGFLCEDDPYTPEVCDLRGNRLRPSEWMAQFSRIADMGTNILQRDVRDDGRPDAGRLLPQFRAMDTQDCFTARILTATRTLEGADAR